MTDHLRKKMKHRNDRRARTRRRIRGRIHGTADRPRLCVKKSLRYVYVQLIDDEAGRTLAQANSAEKDILESLEGSGSGVDAAKAVGEAIAERAKAQGVDTVVFDRGTYRYHGKVKTLADAAREKGLRF